MHLQLMVYHECSVLANNFCFSSLSSSSDSVHVILLKMIRHCHHDYRTFDEAIDECIATVVQWKYRGLSDR